MAEGHRGHRQGAALSERDEALSLVDDLARLAREGGASRIEVRTDAFSVAVSVDEPPTPLPRVAPALASEPARPAPRRVHAGAVGIYSAAREWTAGDAVRSGDVLGAIQSLGHMAEVIAPVEGSIAEVLVTGGAPVEYGQPLFVITPG